MKTMLKRITGLVLLAVFILNFSACGESKKYKFNANNRFYVNNDYLYWINNDKIAALDLEEGDIDYNYYDIPQDIDKNNIIGLWGSFECVVKGKDELNIVDFYDYSNLRSDIIELLGGNQSKTYNTSIIPNNNYTAILAINHYDETYIVTLNGKKLSLYGFYDSDNSSNLLQEFNLEKRYDSAFYLGGDTIGLVKDKEIDLFNLFQSKNEYSSLPTHIILDKQYDAYVGGYSSNILLFIEGNRVRFYLIKEGKFASVGGEEYSWTF